MRELAAGGSGHLTDSARRQVIVGLAVMKVLLAGATGAIGRPLVTALRQAGHEVFAVTRSTDRGARLRREGAEPVVADVLDREALLRAVDGLAADAVIHQLTALHPPPARHSGMARTNALRVTGTEHLLAAAHTVGARRFVTQSMIPGYGYVDHGATPLTEDAPFGQPRGSKKCDPIAAAMRSAEQQAFTAKGIEGVALRYGAFYGPGPASDGLIDMLRRKKLPAPKGGGGTLGWIYIEDAAAATVAALERGRAGQAYNVVDDEPVTWGDLLDAMAAAFGAATPRRLPGWIIRLAAPYFADLMIGTSMRVANAKAKAELDWKPAMPTYRDGLAAMRALV